MRLALRASASSGWLPAAILAMAAALAVAVFGVPIWQVAIFGTYVAFGIALPGMLWVRLLRDRPAHISEDIAMGLAVGYCVEVATYIAARAVGAPLLFLLWPILTLGAFGAVPAVRRHWRGDGTRAPVWWSWSLAAMFAFLLVYSAGTFFTRHHLTGTDTPYVDMPYHLALIGELRHHMPPDIPYVAGVPLAYHWFSYAEAAATSWATGIEPVTLLYRLSALPMFAAFVVLTAAAARRLTGGWWTGPLAVAMALFGTVAGPYQWTHSPVVDTQTLEVTWTSPTNLFGLALFAALILVFIDLLHAKASVPRRSWVLAGVLVFGAAGAKASLLPLLIVGLLVAILGIAISRRRLHRSAAAGLALVGIGLVLATILLFRGMTGGLVIGLDSLRSFLVVRAPGAQGATGIASLVMPVVGWLIALVLWSLLWAGAYGVLARRERWHADPRILFTLGICAGGLGAVTVFLYPGGSQLFFLKAAAGAFGLLTAAGIAAILPARDRYGPLVACAGGAALVGALAVLAIEALGPAKAPTLGGVGLAGVLAGIILPVLALVGVAAVAYLVLRRLEPRWPVLQGAVALLVVALMLGFSLPKVAQFVVSPLTHRISGPAISGDGIDAARWLRDHSDPDDLVATNMHCRPLPVTPNVCDARHFWVSAYSERHMLVEGWAYTTQAIASGLELDVNDRTVPFWDQPLLAENELAFSNPTPAVLAGLRDRRGVRWLFADLAHADADALGREADLRHRDGDYAVYELHSR